MFVYLSHLRADVDVILVFKGTVPFMAIELLQNFDIDFTHAYYHDLESLFYVICWICTTYGGPNGKCRHERYIEDTNVHKWNVQDFSDKTLKDVAKLKYAFASDKKQFRPEIEREFHKYFAPIFDFICRMRSCLFPSPMDPEMVSVMLAAMEGRKDPEGIRAYRNLCSSIPLKDRKPQMVFEELFDAIDEAREQLSEEHRLKDEYPPGAFLVFLIMT